MKSLEWIKEAEDMLKSDKGAFLLRASRMGGVILYKGGERLLSLNNLENAQKIAQLLWEDQGG